MNIRGFIRETDELELSLSITMKIKEWRDLQKDLPERWPHWKLGQAISDAVSKVQTSVNEEIKVE